MTAEHRTPELAPARTAAGRLLRRVVGPELAARRRETVSRLRYAITHRSSRQRLAALKHRHAGERCFIIGNGPSLNRTDMSLLRDEYTFGLNRISLAFDRIGYETSCLVCVNPHVLRQSGMELSQFVGPKFFSVAGAKHMRDADGEITYVRPTVRPEFSTFPPNGMWEGATVTFVALQLAYWMGFRRVVLVGVDHNFSTTGPAHQLVTSRGADADHFDPRYFGAGYEWQLPDLVTSEIAYRAAQSAYERAGREVLDATVGGKLQVFEKIRLEDLF